MMGRQALLKASAPVFWTLANTTTEFWLRPSDPQTVTLSSGVSQIISANGNGRIFTGASGSRPGYTAGLLNNKAGLTLNGSQWLTFSGASSVWDFLHRFGGAVVAAWRAGNGPNPNALYGLLGNSAATTGNHGFAFFFDDRSTAARNERAIAQVARGVSSAAAVLNMSGDFAHPPNTPVILSHIFTPGATTAGRSIIRVNGVTIQNNTDTNAVSSVTATFPLQIGTVGGGLFPAVCELYEVGIFPAGTSLATVEQAEGYLAGPAGFNLQGILAAGHPFRNSPPYL